MKFFLTLLFSFLITSCGESEKPSNRQPTKSTESNTSVEFNSAMEQGDYDRGIAVLREAIEKPNPTPEVLFNMGLVYQLGAGVEKDSTEAASWYEKAAKLGDPEAQFNLGVFYAAGTGVSKSEKKAAILYRQAAVQGNSSAQYNLGRAYLAAEGVSKNREKAYVWLSQAVSSNGPAVAPSQRTILKITDLMTNAQLARAKIAAERCKLSQFRDCPEI